MFLGIDYAVRHETVFHQFMLYTPIPGTPLHEKHTREGNLLPQSEFPFADAHGQYRFNYKHPHFKNGEEENHLLGAFRQDFEDNGPSLLRLIRVLLNSWQKHNLHSPRVGKRIAWETAPLRSTYAGAVWAMTKYQHNSKLQKKAGNLLADIYAEFGWKTRLVAPLIGRHVHRSLKKEEARLAAGDSYEPRTFCDKNAAALALEQDLVAERKTSGRRLELTPHPASYLATS